MDTHRTKYTIVFVLNTVFMYENLIFNHIHKIKLCFFQDETLRTRKKEREDLGVDLYGIQQELARFQMMLEKRHDEFSEVQQVRQQEEQQLNDVQNMYKDLQLKANQEKKKSRLHNSYNSLILAIGIFCILN